MPYLHCPSCRLTAYSAARWSSRDTCARCGAELTPKPRPLFGIHEEVIKGDEPPLAMLQLPPDVREADPPPAAPAA